MSSWSEKEQEKMEGEQREEHHHQVKRPMNAFMLWSKEKRRKISSVDPSLHNSHISKILGEEWKRLPMQDKDPYIKQSKLLMDKHKQEHPDYHYKPRQNKLTKALKELSSLHSTLTTPPGISSRLKSLSSMPVYHPHAARYDPYQAFARSRILLSRGSDLYDVPYHSLQACYPPPPPCQGCTCTSECPESRAWLPHHRQASPPKSTFEVSSASSSPSRYFDRPIARHGVWRVSALRSPRYGWSVPTLVDEACERMPEREAEKAENGGIEDQYQESENEAQQEEETMTLNQD